jgi:branched-chain amino acid transport system substrate-binding protein
MNKTSFPLRGHTIILLRLCLSAFLLIAAGNMHAIKAGSPANEPVRIGLLIQEKESLAARQGAEMAISMANKKGGFKGRPFQLFTKDMEGPWGTGSRMAVDLIWEDKVWALIGSHDGRNAHLVEQAATKSMVVFISAWSSDPTLSQAFVPWFFNVVPNDRQQADALINEIHNRQKIATIAVISDKNYDNGMALKYFIQSSRSIAKANPLQFQVEDYAADLNKLAAQIKKTGAGCVVIFCTPSTSLKLVRVMKQKAAGLPLFGTLSILNENELKEPEIKECADVFWVPHGVYTGAGNQMFRNAYFKKYGKMPGLVASYAFDATSALVEAIKTAGVSDREKIQEALYKIRFDGVTGMVQFDEKGNRTGKPIVSTIRFN